MKRCTRAGLIWRRGIGGWHFTDRAGARWRADQDRPQAWLAWTLYRNGDAFGRAPTLDGAAHLLIESREEPAR